MRNDLKNMPMMTSKNKVDMRELNYNIKHKKVVIIEVRFCVRMK